jgi:hypothetical protein
VKKLAAWLAIAAMALNALWPLIAQARPANLVPLCTVGGVTHYVEVPGAPSPADSHGEHCSFCFVGVALPVADPVHAFEALGSDSPSAIAFSSRTSFFVEADARAPPVFPSVDSSNDYGRNHEEAFAFCAARPDLGGSLVRLGVLHG